MSKLSLSCSFCSKPIFIWPCRRRIHNFCSQPCLHKFRVEKANKERDSITFSPKLPKLPPELNKNLPKLTEQQIQLGKYLLESGNSERFVAQQLGVSRHVVKMHCKPGYREWYDANFRNKAYRGRFPRNPETEKQALNRRRKLVKATKPEEYSRYVRERNAKYRDSIRRGILKKGQGKYIKELAS